MKHQQEDKNIPKDTPLIAQPKPGAELYSEQPHSTNTNSNKTKIFDGKAKQYELHTKTPVIVIETFKNKDGRLVCGITTKEEKEQKPGDNYIASQNGKKIMHSVIICPTTSSYAYVFRNAELRPHFVTSREKLEQYLLKIIPHDIKITKFCNEDLNEPIEIISDHLISNNDIFVDCVIVIPEMIN